MVNRKFQLWYQQLRRLVGVSYESVSSANFADTIKAITTDSELEYFVSYLKAHQPALLAAQAKQIVAHYLVIKGMVNSTPFNHFLYREMNDCGLLELAELSKETYPVLSQQVRDFSAIDSCVKLLSAAVFKDCLSSPSMRDQFFLLSAKQLADLLNGLAAADMSESKRIKYLVEQYFSGDLCNFIKFLKEKLAPEAFVSIVDKVLDHSIDQLDIILLAKIVPTLPNQALVKFLMVIDTVIQRTKVKIEKLSAEQLQAMKVIGQNLILSFNERLKEEGKFSDATLFLDLCHWVEYEVTTAEEERFSLSGEFTRFQVRSVAGLFLHFLSTKVTSEFDELKDVINFFSQAMSFTRNPIGIYRAIEFVERHYKVDLSVSDKQFFIGIIVNSGNLSLLKQYIREIKRTDFPMIFTEQFVDYIMGLAITNGQLGMVSFLAHLGANVRKFQAHILAAATLAYLHDDQPVLAALLPFLSVENRARIEAVAKVKLVKPREARVDKGVQGVDLLGYSPLKSQDIFQDASSKVVIVVAQLIKAAKPDDFANLFFSLLVILSATRQCVAQKMSSEKAEAFGKLRDRETLCTPMHLGSYSRYSHLVRIPGYARSFPDSIKAEARQYVTVYEGELDGKRHHVELTRIRLGSKIGWDHTTPGVVRPCLHLAKNSFIDVLNARSKEEFIARLADFIWLFAQITPFNRGSAAILEWFSQALALAKGYQLPAVDRDCLLDCFVLNIPSKTIFRTFFANTVGREIRELAAAEQITAIDPGLLANILPLLKEPGTDKTIIPFPERFLFSRSDEPKAAAADGSAPVGGVPADAGPLSGAGDPDQQQQRGHWLPVDEKDSDDDDASDDGIDLSAVGSIRRASTCVVPGLAGSAVEVVEISFGKRSRKARASQAVVNEPSAAGSEAPGGEDGAAVSREVVRTEVEDDDEQPPKRARARQPTVAGQVESSPAHHARFFDASAKGAKQMVQAEEGEAALELMPSG